jgi:hypothetical protein
VTDPRRPVDDSREALGFVRQPMVRWLDPRQLVQTGVRVAVAGLFGAYADKREIQAALPREARVHRRYRPWDEIWIDYVADLGDGWEPTYTLAYLLSREHLNVDGVERELLRGQVLVMGGDQVYPTASRIEYENRMRGPYRAALPCTKPTTSPDLFAIPGNHDWYDGLTNFLRFFCQRKWIGGWRTRQDRSYFALQLPHRWWLWAVDIQFDVYIDEPQVRYFRRIAREFEPGDRVILVTGKPSWKHGTDKPNLSYDNIRYLEERIIEPRGRLVVSLSGDDHHYARYEEETQAERKRQKITSGGGGAALSATHHLQERLSLTRLDDERKPDAVPTHYGLRRRYPGLWESRLRPLAAPLWLPLRNLSFLPGVLGVYLVPAILLQTPVKKELARNPDAGFTRLLDLVVSSKFVLYAALALVPPLVLFAAVKSIVRRFLVGGTHAVAHLGLLALAIALSGSILGGLGSGLDLAVASLAAGLATVPGACLVAVYLAFCDVLFGERMPRHAGEVFAAQQIKDRKNFLRMHIDGDGALWIYPIGIDRVARTREIHLRMEGEPGDAWFEIPDAERRLQLLEAPVRVV